jgi:hypothetical protein
MFLSLKTRKARIAYLKEQLATNPAWALRGLVRIFEAQTAGEQDANATTQQNGVGFTAHDADLLTSFRKQLAERGTLTNYQLSVLARRMPKYAGQLERISLRPRD